MVEGKSAPQAKMTPGHTEQGAPRAQAYTTMPPSTWVQASKNVPRKKMMKVKPSPPKQVIDNKLESKLRIINKVDILASSLDLIGEDGKVLHFDLKKCSSVPIANVFIIRGAPKTSTIDQVINNTNTGEIGDVAFDKLALNFEQAAKI